MYLLYILVDYSERNGISASVVPERVSRVVDHKSFPLYADFPLARFRIEYVGAAATLIAEEYFFNREIDLPIKIATLLYAAIYSNTLHFGSRMSGFRDERMRDRLATFPIDTAIVQDMTQAKTVYTQDYFEEVLRADDKLMMLDNGLLVDYLQVEVSDATWFLKHDMVTYMQESMHRLHTEHHVLCLLHLHDITQRKTYLLSNYEHFLRYLHVNNFPGMLQESYIALDGLYLRKDTIPMLQPVLSSIDASTILDLFLQ